MIDIHILKVMDPDIRSLPHGKSKVIYWCEKDDIKPICVHFNFTLNFGIHVLFNWHAIMLHIYAFHVILNTWTQV